MPSPLLAAAALVLSSFAQAQGATSPGDALAEEIVNNFRRNILLHEANPGKLTRAQDTAGRFLFFQSRQTAGRLVESLAADTAACSQFVERIETTPDWREIDRLALGGVLLELTLRLASDAPCAIEAQKVRTRLAAIRARYSAELTAALGARAGSARLQRRDWQNYLAFLREHYAGQTLVPELDSPPAVPLPENAVPLAQQGQRDEWTDGGLPPRTVLLTFDDGPHPLHTPRILDILARYRIKAVFFQVGQNIGTLDSAGRATLREPRIFERLRAEGHTIANHSHTHPLLIKLDEVKLTDEIDRTEALLAAANRDPANATARSSRAALFRAPYGARNDLVLAGLAARGLRSVLWNIDSRDWADPLSRSVAHRVIGETLREGRGIILFHDIHSRAVDALPTVIDELQKQGYRFARFEQGELVVDE